MAKFAVLKNSIVVNHAEADAAFAAAQGWIAAGASKVGDTWAGGVFTTPPPPPLDRLAAAADIDSAVARIYAGYDRFALEYKEREAQARAYKAAGYTGAVPVQVAAFATPAGKTPAEATDIIIGQADALLGALSALGVQRMRKYAVLGAPDDAAARAVLADINVRVAAIAAALQ